MATTMGLRAGWSMDITTNDIDGKALDFNVLEMRNRAARRVLNDRPMLLIGSPMCTVHSVMNNVNHAHMPPEIVKERFNYARKHLRFATQLYKLQIQGGRYFLHEHPEWGILVARRLYKTGPANGRCRQSRGRPVSIRTESSR